MLRAPDRTPAEAVSSATSPSPATSLSSTRSLPAARLQALHPALRLPVLVLVGSLVMVLCARANVPFWPVPMTLHVFGTMLLAGLFGGRTAGLMVLAYLAEGAAGLPVFSYSPTAGAGLAYLAGPTGGYLVGFAVAAFVAGTWIERRGLGGSWRMLVPMLAGLVLVYLLGGLWLAPFVGLSKVATVGILPFLPGDLVKVALAAAACLAVRDIARRVR
ncbi:biotin transport system substrate-specific component [Pseudoxanthobacter soli DSM 19599]|uniref:Biotin transport system substrate-specific component n=1 Tax=Pseudoxanthobacter soli DSM 19599 TaxID=1123029 RepID=A0A1M7Z8D1_9HYPH|nr:biotin transporter BioY [Pseudoxanthobacter soli]SHO61171.1 biotin transport system substrate-specific component [Pseudoxanthobacter soli DSM 19599]